MAARPRWIGRPVDLLSPPFQVWRRHEQVGDRAGPLPARQERLHRACSRGEGQRLARWQLPRSLAARAGGAVAATSRPCLPKPALMGPLPAIDSRASGGGCDAWSGLTTPTPPPPPIERISALDRAQPHVAGLCRPRSCSKLPPVVCASCCRWPSWSEAPAWPASVWWWPRSPSSASSPAASPPGSTATVGPDGLMFVASLTSSLGFLLLPLANGVPGYAGSHGARWLRLGHRHHEPAGHRHDPHARGTAFEHPAMSWYVGIQGAALAGRSLRRWHRGPAVRHLGGPARVRLRARHRRQPHRVAPAPARDRA